MNAKTRKEIEISLLRGLGRVKKVQPLQTLEGSTSLLSWRRTSEEVYKKLMVMKDAMVLEKQAAGVFAAVQIPRIRARVLP